MHWTEMPAPTHVCTICGAMWRYYSEHDEKDGKPFWNLRSERCEPCCDLAPMADQIRPVTAGELYRWLHAKHVVGRFITEFLEST